MREKVGKAIAFLEVPTIYYVFFLPLNVMGGMPIAV